MNSNNSFQVDKKSKLCVAITCSNTRMIVSLNYPAEYIFGGTSGDLKIEGNLYA